MINYKEQNGWALEWYQTGEDRRFGTTYILRDGRRILTVPETLQPRTDDLGRKLDYYRDQIRPKAVSPREDGQ